MKYAAKTETGKRKNNEDAFTIPSVNGDFPYIAVSDGMGGHAKGEVASSLTLSESLSFLRELKGPVSADQLKSSITSANLAVYRMAQARQECAGMGATLVCAILQDSGFIAANAGDSRLYHIHHETIRQVTVDHSYVEELVRSGIITKEQAKHHPQRNLITNAVGIGIRIMPDIYTEKWEKGDYLLLCSDGLHGSIPDEQILATVLKNVPLQDRCDMLINDALLAGSNDNITVAIAYHDGEESAL